MSGTFRSRNPFQAVPMRFSGLPPRAPAPDSLTIIPPGLPFVNTFFRFFRQIFPRPFGHSVYCCPPLSEPQEGDFWGQAGGGLRPHGVFIARNVPGCGNAPRAACRPPLHPMVNRTIRREHRPCRNVPAAGSRPRPTNLRKIRTTHKTAIIRQSGETRDSFRPIVGAACRPPVGLALPRADRVCTPVSSFCRAGSRPRPTNLRKIRTTHKTTIIRQSWETRASFRSIVGAACRPPGGLSLAANGQGLHACSLIP